MSAPLLASTTEMVNITIDGVPVSVPKGTLLVEAAKTIRQQIPDLLLPHQAGARGALPHLPGRDRGHAEAPNRLQHGSADGMVVRTSGERVEAARAMVLELFLVNHPLDCPICDKGGECDLQDYAMAYARGTSDVADPKLAKPKAVDLGPTIVLDEERCIVCQRCVRFDDIIAGERQLVVKDRGARDIIATATGLDYRHNFTGNVTELCPVGALTSKTYRFKSRPWDLNRTQTTCTQCAVGCQQFADVRHGTLLRTMSVEDDDAISDGWLCDRGRYNIGFYESPDRLTQPLYRKDGELRADRLGRCVHLVGEGDSRRDRDCAGPRASARSAAAGLRTKRRSRYSTSFGRSASRIWIGAPAGSARRRPARGGGPLDRIDDAQAIVIAGESPAERAPVLWLRVRKAALRNGAKIVQARNATRGARSRGDALDRVALIWDGVDAALGARVRAGLRRRVRAVDVHRERTGNARGAEAMGMLPV